MFTGCADQHICTFGTIVIYTRLPRKRGQLRRIATKMRSSTKKILHMSNALFSNLDDENFERVQKNPY